MVRTLITPNKEDISIRVPESYIGRTVEVIAFTLDEGKEQTNPAKKEIPFVVLHVADKNFKFDRDEANER